MYKKCFMHAHYFAMDSGVGERAWDYSGLDIVCDVHAISLKSDSVPYILCTQLLEHVNRPHVVVSELYRILKPGGMVFCSLPFIENEHHQEPNDFFRFTKYAAEYLFVSVGFKDVVVNPMGGYNTLLVSFVQKGIQRFVDRQREARRAWSGIAVVVGKTISVLTRWINRAAWARDQRDPSRYRFALGFTVSASK
jgi:SAM-dependent methyltransferase